MRSSLVIICCAVGLLVACHGDEASDPPDLLAQIVAVQADHHHVQGTYRYHNVQPDNAASGAQFWLGRFAFSRPDRYCIRLVEEGQDGFEEYRCDGTWHWKIVSIDPEMEPVVTRVPLAEADQQWRRIGRFILFDRASVEQDFSLVATPLADGADAALSPDARAEVLLVPITDAMRQYLQSVRVQFDAAHQVVAVQIHDNSDNLMTAMVQERDYVTPVDERRFRWGTPPADSAQEKE